MRAGGRGNSPMIASERHALARAALTDQPDRLAARHRERHAIERTHRARRPSGRATARSRTSSRGSLIAAYSTCSQVTSSTLSPARGVCVKAPSGTVTSTRTSDSRSSASESCAKSSMRTVCGSSDAADAAIVLVAHAIRAACPRAPTAWPTPGTAAGARAAASSLPRARAARAARGRRPCRRARARTGRPSRR